MIPSQFRGVADDGVGGLGHVEVHLHPAAEGERREVRLEAQVVLDGADGRRQPGEGLLRDGHGGGPARTTGRKAEICYAATLQ